MFCIGRTKLQRIHALTHRRHPVLRWPHRVDFRASMHWTGYATPISKVCHRICELPWPATPKPISENPCAALQYPKVPCNGAMAWLVGIKKCPSSCRPVASCSSVSTTFALSCVIDQKESQCIQVPHHARRTQPARLTWDLENPMRSCNK